MNLNQLTIKEAHQGLLKKEFSSVELTEAVLGQIKRRNQEINAYLVLTEEMALTQAKKVDKMIANNEEIGLLAGIPAAIKDNIMIDGVQCTAASKILENYIAPYDATVIKKLKKQGAVFVGKTNLDEFAMGSSTENSAFGPTKNPRDLSRVPGGSSGGSAAAVADDQCIYALGSDTGGSIRQPASFCGVAGLKPTYGSVSRYGLIAFASSLDQIGPLAKTTEDCQIIFEAINGRDEMDATSFNFGNQVSAGNSVSNLKIGIPKEYFVAGIDSAVEEAVRGAISQYEKMGFEIVEISLPHTEYALPVYYIIMPAEASSNLARYDGIKYGLSEIDKDLLGGYLKTRQKGFGDEVKRRIMLGTYVLSAGYYDAYYLKAQKVRTLIKNDFLKAFEKVDVLITPTAPTPAFKIGQKIADPVSMYLSDIYTISANLAGLPAISIPIKSNSPLPIGMQIIGKQFGENDIFKIARAYENLGTVPATGTVPK
ncbi:Asp-tRNA(Asn)/Glu-tRNA(Gln) amidotransferase subunit GatA [Patescibacteria group bacterium]|nr:Asp-tRNA(Asn)/Glu-tRNA(Gln) amidotransferase subunit GatA [Patescibacteria group bacterium]MBU2579763.1 Asp-tRNA(Asn)/Glu-tRNA(Gln) amidotransferase subunit GatA [Patescibacteria group bacterium]